MKRITVKAPIKAAGSNQMKELQRKESTWSKPSEEKALPLLKKLTGSTVRAE